MPPNAMNTRMIKETLRYKLELGHSHERTARALHISKGVVAKYVTLAKTADLDWAQIAAMTEAELQARLMPPSGTADGADTGDEWDPGNHAIAVNHRSCLPPSQVFEFIARCSRLAMPACPGMAQVMKAEVFNPRPLQRFNAVCQAMLVTSARRGRPS